MDDVQPQDEEIRLPVVPSLGKLLMSAPFEPGDLPERNKSPMRDMFAELLQGEGDEISD
jgi:hypothetical protein